MQKMEAEQIDIELWDFALIVGLCIEEETGVVWNSKNLSSDSVH